MVDCVRLNIDPLCLSLSAHFVSLPQTLTSAKVSFPLKSKIKTLILLSLGNSINSQFEIIHYFPLCV